MENAVDTGALLEGAASGDAASVVEGWMQAGWGMLSVEKALSALVLLAVSLAAIRLAMTLVGRLLERSSLDQRTGRYIQRGIRWLLYLLAALMAAGSLGIDVTSLIAMVSVFGLAVSLAVQDVLSNVAGGMVLLFSKPFTLGDYIATDDGEGEVAEMGLTHTKLDTFSGQRVMLPNSKLTAAWWRERLSTTRSGASAGRTSPSPPPTATAPARSAPPASRLSAARRTFCRIRRPRWCSPPTARALWSTASASGPEQKISGTPTTRPWRRSAAALRRTASP